MPTNPPPATNVDTSGVVGNAGAIPLGSQYTSAGDKDTTEIGAGGSVTARPGPPLVSATPDTEAVYGPNQPGSYSPVSTLVSATLDTSQGYAGNMSHPVYRAPNLAGTPASTVDTENALGYTAAVPTDVYPWVTGGTIETPNLGAPTGSILTATDTRTLDQTTPTAVTSHLGVIGAAASIVVVDNGQIITITAESHTIHTASDFTLTHAGVTDNNTQIVVKKGATTLVRGTDYSATATGSGATANFNIRALSGAAADGDTVTVTYHYGNATHFTPATLVLTTDYTVTFTATGQAQRTFTLLRNSGSSAAANGDSVAVTYQYGNAAYWGTHDPTAVPPAPTIGTAVALDRSAKVVWTAPTLAATDDVDGYIVQSDTGGTRYVPGQYTQFLFQQLTPGVGITFRVAAFNDAGLGQWSAFSNSVTPLNYDEVATGSLDPRNTVNPIYNADGTTVGGTGLGAGGIVPGGDYPW
jgi:hypothetical protein